jgi:putative hydrolase of the HAD superfamily
MPNLPEVVIFDLDNTLYEYQPADISGTTNLINFLHENLKMSKSRISDLLAESRLKVKESLVDIASSHSRLMYIRDFINSNGLYVHATFALECEQVFWRGYMNEMKLFDGVLEFVSFLRLSKVKLVMVTDLTTQIQLRKLSWLGLENAFDLIITSEEAGGDKKTGKPEALLRNFLNPVEGNFWAVGDNDDDHLFPKETLFFKKITSGKLSPITDQIFEFSNYKDLLKSIR